MDVMGSEKIQGKQTADSSHAISRKTIYLEHFKIDEHVTLKTSVYLSCLIHSCTRSTISSKTQTSTLAHVKDGKPEFALALVQNAVG